MPGEMAQQSSISKRGLIQGWDVGWVVCQTTLWLYGNSSRELLSARNTLISCFLGKCGFKLHSARHDLFPLKLLPGQEAFAYGVKENILDTPTVWHYSLCYC